MKRKIAEKLLDIKAVALNPNDPFIWSSGLRAPIYCDNRLTLSYPEVRKEIAAGLKSIILDKFPEAELIAGTATAGIPHAAWVSDIMELPMCYVRSKAKGHGKGKQIEGKADKGQKVVVVEDLISTGGSAITAVKALREAGCEVLGVAAIFTYQLEKGKEMLDKEKIEAYTLTDIEALTEVAVENGYIQEKDMKKLVEWRKDPAEWGKVTQ
ncbi:MULTISPECIES: orotate phosphoribosyltransferase [Cytobacillus]|jgi:orotate phosphoribosyltransferase|uniref:Orotate phosphoribosyltransferase n=1 Tax=Cytobacillus oceanisediminis 2691 TaxID=1196031 RepID=A0A169FKL1_9BACI|nr:MULTISPECIES: orotate phosphoribosyltransferase [Cytobacillus]MBY0157473.1 orotate phosphoribosyltransferase [Cytobacillus firmus]AND39325.1 orotate phosphoribosyltransferase [Cytobacillus oceanisediminis 2691]MBU8768512.1 orotate phosphoribosyltransferase [Cytobacillus oceanisediminis]MCM3242911.1 orotate phosphoribosyltransferase [Cytobacillus oceanisediminis]MCM3394157.1 orotate phosphoribosyltransferase [Cytobacillus oceanisediminis]